MFFERPDKGLRTVVLSLRVRSLDYRGHDIEEMNELAISAGLEVVHVLRVNRDVPNPATCIGSGKIDELAKTIGENRLELLLIDYNLTASQQRNLETKLNVRVMTRTELILHVFEQRARTHEGKLQVELAMLRHAQTHVVRGWTHLDRQRGAVNLRGVGETQLAIDQRLLQKRIHATKQKLDRVKRQRLQQRSLRAGSQIPIVALVGYTNVGKSTLFNVLTQAEVYADDRLFATLDPTIRKLNLGGGLEVLLTDTVGFIKDLPMDLVAAFQATLEEIAEADLLVLVLDVMNSNPEEIRESVAEVLTDINAEKIPTITVYNKVDASAAEPGIRGEAVYVSALHEQGLEDLRRQISHHFNGLSRQYCIHLQPKDGKVRSLLYDMDVVQEEECDEQGNSTLMVQLAGRQVNELESAHGITVNG